MPVFNDDGTVALDLALVGLKIGMRNEGRAEDEVIVSNAIIEME